MRKLAQQSGNIFGIGLEDHLALDGREPSPHAIGFPIGQGSGQAKLADRAHRAESFRLRHVAPVHDLGRPVARDIAVPTRVPSPLGQTQVVSFTSSSASPRQRAPSCGLTLRDCSVETSCWPMVGIPAL